MVVRMTERKEGELVRRRMEKKERERGSEEDGEEGGREVVRKWMERNKAELVRKEGQAVRRRERKEAER